MDRHDEKKDDRAEAVERQGDVLGLGHASVPKTPGDPTAADDPESVSRRRARAMGADADPGVTHEDPDRQRSGATGIDMGAGGQGTHLSGE